MSDIIDLTRYLDDASGDDESPRGAFALWGADGERSRFALPLWRAIYLAGGDRGGIVWRPPGGSVAPVPFVVLDLGQEPARLGFEAAHVAGLAESGAPEMVDRAGDGDLVVFLGERDGRRWYLVTLGTDGRDPVAASEREDILFLAGECAGLLFLRDFADLAGEVE